MPSGIFDPAIFDFQIFDIGALPGEPSIGHMRGKVDYRISIRGSRGVMTYHLSGSQSPNVFFARGSMSDVEERP
jgi:hypothetical protein